MPLNKFEVLKDRVIQKGKGSGKEVVKDFVSSGCHNSKVSISWYL